MVNAVNVKANRNNRVFTLWPPEALTAPLNNVDDYIRFKKGTERAGFRWSTAMGFLGALAASLIIGYLLINFRDGVAQLGEWGYLGLFFIEMANSATVLFPTPGQSYAFALGVSLNPVLIGLIGGVGSAIGELTGYALGAKTGQRFRRGRKMEKLQAITMRWGGMSLFLFAMIPGPFEIAGLWAGTVRYPITRFFMFVALGKIIKVMGFAFAGYYSISWLLGTAN